MRKRKKKVVVQNNKIKNATPLIYNDIRFRSKLEVYCYKKLLENNLEFTYEEHIFTLIDKFVFTNDSIELISKNNEKIYKEQSNNIRAITYTPDFVSIDMKWIIECKGFANDIWPLKWKMFKKHILDNNLNIDLYVPGNRKQIDETIEIIKVKYGR